MKIPVLGMDPSLRNWGLASGMLDLDTGHFDLQLIDVIQPLELQGKQVRNNSNDLHMAEQLASGFRGLAQRAKVIFVEVPVGSQSARAMASYGVCIGILGTLRSNGIQVIEVTATEVKLALAGMKDATKGEMIAAAMTRYPQAEWPMHRGKIANKAEHCADAVGAIHAGVKTPVFQNLMRLFETART